MIKLEDVQNKAYFAMRKAQVEAMKTERLGQIHVSDVIKPCMRYVIYQKTMPETGMSTEDEISEADDSEEDTVEEAEKSDEDTVEEAEKSDEDTVDEEFEIDESLFK